MATSQAIPNTRITGTQVFTFSNTPAGAQWATVTIDRTVAQGLNTLTNADTLQINFDRSIDNGTTWIYEVAGITCVGGTIVTKGVTLARDMLTVGIPQDNTTFQITCIASTPVRIAGTVDYTP